MSSTANEVTKYYSPREELAHAITHGAGIALSVVALTLMVVSASFSGDGYKIVSVSVFGASMVLLYSFSTIYHSLREPALKRIFRLVDHSCIYILIAGTYTPFTLVALKGGWGWSLFGVIWGLAVCGIVFKVFCIGKLRFLSLAVYLGMGWLGVVAVRPIFDVLPAAGLFWLAAGGLMYTFGVVFFIWHKLQYHHAVWHLFVLGGTACHFFSVYFYVLTLEA